MLKIGVKSGKTRRVAATLL